MTSAHKASNLARLCSRAAAAGLAGGIGFTITPAATAAPAVQAPTAQVAPASAASTYITALASASAAGTLALGDRLPPGRRIVVHVVRPGDTATGLAVRYHAWTRELIALNRLGSSARLHVGQRLRIPVVIAAEKKANATKKPASTKPATAKPATTWKHADPSRATVRRIIIDTARRHGVDPELALAISWQEAGWQMHHVSSADAIGAMQVVPDTGTWMEQYAGRSLNLYDVRDNVLAGVLLLKVLDRHTVLERRQIGAYYQGLGAVRRHGLFPETRAYVANVQAIRRRLEAGRSPG